MGCSLSSHLFFLVAMVPLNIIFLIGSTIGQPQSHRFNAHVS